MRLCGKVCGGCVFGGQGVVGLSEPMGQLDVRKVACFWKCWGYVFVSGAVVCLGLCEP